MLMTMIDDHLEAMIALKKELQELKQTQAEQEKDAEALQQQALREASVTTLRYEINLRTRERQKHQKVISVGTVQQ